MKVINKGNIIFSELPQLLGVMVCYRRPIERLQNLDKIALEKQDLSHVPLLEGEEQLKALLLSENKIQ